MNEILKLEKLEKGRKISNMLRKMHIDVRKKLFKEIHEVLGGKIKRFYFISIHNTPERGQSLLKCF